MVLPALLASHVSSPVLHCLGLDGRLKDKSSLMEYLLEVVLVFVYLWYPLGMRISPWQREGPLTK